MRSRENTLTKAGPGFLDSRLGPLPVAWKPENELRMVLQNEYGEEGSVDEGDNCPVRKAKSGLVSETGKSDGASSIFLVPDHGFVAASEKYVGPVGSTGGIMGTDELQDHAANLQEKEPSCVAEAVFGKIERSLVASVMDSRPTREQEQYLPVDALYRILDTKTILSLMKEVYPDATNQELCTKVADITGSHEGKLVGKCRRRILAILLFCERLDAQALDAFIRDGVWDEDLPLRSRDNSPGHLSHCSTKTNPNHINTTLLKGWRRNKISLFYTYQSTFHVPFFEIQEDKLCSYEFSSKVRLPWTSFEKVADGGGGTVYRIEIHPAHHNYGPYSAGDGTQPTKPAGSPVDDKNREAPIAFALKRINSPEGESYKQELLAHEKACAKLQKGEHIIKLLLTYEHDGHHYLMFEWADGALDDFWEKRMAKAPPHAESWASERWAANQCYGLATALKQIHGLATWQDEKRKAAKKDRDLSLGPGPGENEDKAPDYGRHGDIKPKNILWFSRYRDRKDHLVISDLGLTRYHTEFSRSKMAASKVEGFSEAYRPPELDLPGKEISRKSDIWSLGCVFLEFCIWYLEGGDGISRFEQQREDDDKSDIRGLKELKFFILASDTERGEREAKLKPIVEQWLLKAHELGSPFARQMLGIVKAKMLKIELAEREHIDKISLDILDIVSSLKQDVELNDPPLPSPTSPVPMLEDVQPSTEFGMRRTIDAMERDVLHATGNTDIPEVDKATKRPLTIRTVGSNLSADNIRSGSNTAVDEKNHNYDDETTPVTQTEGHGFSQQAAEMDDSQCLPTQTPFTTMENSQVLEGTPPRERHAVETKRDLPRLDTIQQTPPLPDLSDDGAGFFETKQSEDNRETTPMYTVSEAQVVVPKSDAPPIPPVETVSVLQVTQTAELVVSTTVSITNTATPEVYEMPEPSEGRSTDRGSRRWSVRTTSTGKAQKAYLRLKAFKEKLVTKLRKGK